MKEVKRVFKVNGKSFFPIGGQSCNSSGYNEKTSETAFKVIKLLHGNTLEIPVYWDNIEPEEGKFNFSAVDNLLASARRYEVKLILLWFATWKNGNMDYAPAWVKNNPQYFKRVISPAGKDLWVLSSHCAATLEADKKAFVALCNHLKLKDSTEQTVIALQIENEPGIIGSDRDYGFEAQATFDNPIPDKLMSELEKGGRGTVYNLWRRAAGKESGTWPEIFGYAAGEMMTAWSIANYIDSIAEAGKTVYRLPMYINVWLLEQPSWRFPGETYPSGGAVSKVLDIYKWFTPHVDIIAPDNYKEDSRSYETICAIYSRDDNPFFMPETGFIGNSHGWNIFRAIAEYNLIGDAVFGVEYLVNEDGSVRPEFEAGVDSIRCVAAVIPLLLKYQGTGRVHAVIQEDLLWSQHLDFEGHAGLVEFGAGRDGFVGRDWRHKPIVTIPEQTDGNRGCGLIIQASKNEFYLVGANYRLYLRPNPSILKTQSPRPVIDPSPRQHGYFTSIDEGHFDNNGEFVVDLVRNGDEISRGLWVEPDIGVLRVITCD
jgi:hypothetical protein